jgi:hypothetical protein
MVGFQRLAHARGLGHRPQLPRPATTAPSMNPGLDRVLGCRDQFVLEEMVENEPRRALHAA